MKNITRTFCVVMISLFATGCTKAGLFVANMPAAFNGANTYKDISYSALHDKTLDVYVPDDVQGKAPVIVFFYGGRWTEGRKEQYRFVANAFLDEGYAVVIPDYRKYPNVKFPDFVKDAAEAVAWVHNNAAQYGIDQNAIFVSGHSSGAHIAALIATDPQYLEAYDLDRSIISAFAGLSGPYAFVPEDEDLKDMFGPPERYPLMRAPNFVDGNQPPMLLIHGLDDETVVLKNAKKLQTAVNDKGGYVDLITYKKIDHIETVGSLMWFWSYKADIKDKVVQFFEKYDGRE